MSAAERIYEKVKMLPESTVNEVLYFIEFLEIRQGKPKPMKDARKDTWLSNVWGCSPDFPDRLPDPPPEAVEVL
jgi:hypothetical protein